MSDITIHLPAEFAKDHLLQLKGLLAKYHTHDGGVGVHIIVQKGEQITKVTTSFRIATDPKVLNELTALVGLRSVRYTS